MKSEGCPLNISKCTSSDRALGEEVQIVLKHTTHHHQHCESACKLPLSSAAFNGNYNYSKHYPIDCRFKKILTVQFASVVPNNANYRK